MGIGMAWGHRNGCTNVLAQSCMRAQNQHGNLGQTPSGKSDRRVGRALLQLRFTRMALNLREGLERGYGERLAEHYIPW